MKFHNNLNPTLWQKALTNLSVESQDIYFTPEYHQLHVANGDGQAVCFWAEEDEAHLVIPGVKTPILQELAGQDQMLWCDLQTCNGYGGPLATPNASPAFLESAWAEWQRHCHANGIVAGFFRLHPLLRNFRWLPQNAQVVVDRQTVFVDLQQGICSVWKKADSRHRNMVNKGRRLGVNICWDDPEGWRDFEMLYREAMRRLSAPKSLMFTTDYFAVLQHLPGVDLACVRTNGIMQAAAVFISGPLYCHYHLSARAAKSDNHLTSCILQAAFERAAERGQRGVHLGGGRTRTPSDSLLSFKLHTGGNLIDFKVGLVVTNPNAYETLCAKWYNQFGRYPDWLLGYRQPGPELTQSDQLATLPSKFSTHLQNDTIGSSIRSPAPEKTATDRKDAVLPNLQLSATKKIPVIGLGAGGHTSVIIETLRMTNIYQVVGLLDSSIELQGQLLGEIPVLGDDQVLRQLLKHGVCHFFNGVGSVIAPGVHRAVYLMGLKYGLKPITVIHPRAYISPSAQIGQGTVILAGALINTNAQIGENVIINTGAIVEHDCRVGDHTHIATGAKLAGTVTIGVGTHIGIGSSIRQSITVGNGVTVGAGTVVVKDIPNDVTVVGVPARILKPTDLTP